MKNLHDIIQKNSETFEKDFVVRHETADPVVRYTDAIKIKQFLLSSQLSIIQAMIELIQKEMYKSLDEVAQYKNEQCNSLVNKEDIKVWIHNLRSFLKEAKTKLK
jgi:hypothetical protein